MHSKVMIEVNRLHWCCISCRLVNKHIVSIDEHLKSCHTDLLLSASASSPCLSPELDQHSLSDGELGLCSQSEEKTTKEELSECPADISVYSADISACSADIPAPPPVQGKHPAHCDKESKVEISNSQNKSRRRNLSFKSSADVTDTETSQNMLSSRLRRNSRSLSWLTANRKENQKCQLRSDTSIRGRYSPQTAEQHPKQELEAHRKRPKLQTDFCNQGAHEDGRCDSGNDNVKGLGTSKENMKISVDKIDIDRNGEICKRARRGRPKGSGKKKTNLGKKLKTVHVEIKKSRLGGKPVKRSLEISEHDMIELKMYYFGSQQTRNSKQESQNAEANVSIVQKDDICEKKCQESTLSGRESVSENNVEMLNAEKFKQLSVAEKNSDLKTACEEKSAFCGPSTCENNLPNVTTDSSRITLTRTSTPTVQGSHTNVTEPSGTETNVTGVCTADTPCPHGNVCRYQSSGLFPVQPVDETTHSMSYDLPPSSVGSNQYREDDILPQIPYKNVHLTRQCTTASGHSSCTTETPMQQLSSLEEPNIYTVDCSFKNTLQTVCSQLDAPKDTEIVQREHPSFPERRKTAESEEWVKNRTNFSFAKTKPALIIEQPSEVHECTVCQAKFSTAEYLSDHVSKMSAHSPAKCQGCQQPFHNIYDLNLHVFGDHEKRSKPFCFECGDKFQSMAAFETHLHGHMFDQDSKLLDMEYHCCNICRTDVPCRYDTLRKHYYNKHKSTMCLECFVRSELVLLPDAVSVREHKIAHANFCRVCIQDFPTFELMQAHYPYHSKHVYKEDGRGSLCERCNQWCPNKALAILHHKEHKLQVMRNWRVEKWGVGIACVHCDKILKNKRNLQRHIAQLHSSCRSYNFQCEFCGKGIDSKNILKDHIAVHHLGIKRYSCEYCDQRFACGTTLRRHILKEHATDRQYTCEMCGERFFERYKLTRHMSIHTGSARFMCEQCGKGFHSSSDFKKHLAVHAEKRDFACQGCGQEYKRKEHLKRHYLKCAKFVHSDAKVDSDISLNNV